MELFVKQFFVKVNKTKDAFFHFFAHTRAYISSQMVIRQNKIYK